MSFNTFGRIFRTTTWGESHGPALGATVDGCPPGVAITETALVTPVPVGVLPVAGVGAHGISESCGWDLIT